MIEQINIESANADSTDLFWNIIKSEVPKLIIDQDAWSIGSVINKEKAQNLALLMTEWLFGPQYEETLKNLEKLNNPPTFCGKTFSAGEANYTCLTCATDPTCVFCQTCFRNSEHINHDYRMHSSNGGGCCDCGDVEAWKSAPSCSLHMSNSENNVDVRSLMSRDLLENIHKRLDIMLRYAADMLTSNKQDDVTLPIQLIIDQHSENAATVVYNDESHTYDYVIRTLSNACQCDNQKASDFATIIDREGRSIVEFNTRSICEQIKGDITKPDELGSRNQVPLSTFVFPINVVAHQEFALVLFSHLTKMSQRCEVVRLILCDIFLQLDGDDAMNNDDVINCVLTKLMSTDYLMWKSARNAYFKLIMATLMMNLEAKKSLSVQYTRLYSHLMVEYMLDDQDLNVSIMCLSVQIFTVPSIAAYLAEHERLLGRLADVFVDLCCNRLPPYENQASHGNFTDDDQLNLNADKHKMKDCINKASNLFCDLKYSLNSPPTEWNEGLKEQFLNFFNTLVKMFGSFEGLDGIKRKTDQHLEHEPEWQTTVTIQMRFVPIIKYLLGWIRTNKEILLRCIGMTMKRLSLLYAEPDTLKTRVIYATRYYDVIEWDITQQTVSVHYPLTRLLAALLATCASCHDDVTNDDVITCFHDNNQQIIAMTDRSVRSLALCAQTLANAWRRNGLSLVNQVYYSKEIRCRPESFDRDLQMLQIAAALVEDHNLYFVTLLHRFNIINPPTNFDKNHKIILEEEFTTLLIYIFFERYNSNIGDVDFKTTCRREVIHALASSPKPHSKIDRVLSEEITDDASWEDILKEVAEIVPPTVSNAVAKYRLKDESVLEVNPHYYHYSNSNEQTNAIDETFKRRKSAKQSLVFVPRPSPRFKKMWERAIFVLCSHAFMDYMRQKLTNPSMVEDTSKNSSDKLLEVVLYLIGSAIVEERERVKLNPEDPFNFCQQAEQELVMEAIRQGVDKEVFESHKDMLCWIINAYDDIQQTRLGVNNSTSDSSSVEATSPSSTAADTEAKQNRKKAAEARRKAMMEKMKKQQEQFVAKNSSDYAAVSEDTSSNQPNNVDSYEDMDTSDSYLLEMEIPVCFNSQQQIAAANQWESADICILCQDGSKKNQLVLAAYVQTSSVLCKDRSSCSSEKFQLKQFVDITNPYGVHISTCSHAMHYTCWSGYFEHQKKLFLNRHMRRGYKYDALKNEYDCPLCRRLSNCVIPVTSQLASTRLRGILAESSSFPLPSTSSTTSSITSQQENSVEFLTRMEQVIPPPTRPPTSRDTSQTIHQVSSDSSVESSTSSDDPASMIQNLLETTTTQQDPTSPTLVPPNVVQDAGQPNMSHKESIKASFQEMERCITSPCIQAGTTSNNMDFYLILWRSISYTISTNEMVSRLKNEVIMKEPSIRDKKTLTGMIRSAFLASRLKKPPRKETGRILRLLLGDTDENGVVLLTSHIFSSLVNLLYASDAYLKKKTSNCILDDRNILHLCTIAQIAQILLFVETEEITTSEAICDSNLIRAMNQIRHYAGLEPLNQVDDTKLENLVKKSLLPYLKCCTLLMRYYSGVEPSTTLTTCDDMQQMLIYLDLPTDICDIICFDGSIHPALQKWCANPLIKSFKSMNEKRTFPYLVSDCRLVNLEKDYSDVMALSTTFKCPRFPYDDEAVHPTLCLICGTILCSQTYCCHKNLDGEDVGPSTFHCYHCNYNHGILLRIRKCRILLLNRSRGCFRPAPYVDRHGETDVGLKRGNPLHLDANRMKELNLMWLNHEIDDVTVRDSDVNHHYVNVGWSMM